MSSKKCAKFVINLDKDIARRNYIEEHFKELGVRDYKIIQAVDGRSLSESDLARFYDEKLAIEKYGRKLFPGEIGCALSHLNCYKEIIEQNLPGAFIFEDDVRLYDSAKILMEQIEFKFLHEKTIPAVNIVLLSGAKYVWKHKKLAYLSLGCNLHRVHKASCAHGYFVTKEAVVKLLDYYSPIFTPVDIWERVSKATAIKIYTCKPECVGVKAVTGSISSTRNTSEVLCDVKKQIKKRPLYRRIYRKIRSFYPKKIFQKIAEYTVGIQYMGG